MAGTLDALRQFFRPTGPTFAPPDSVFIKIDRKATAESLRLEQRATDAAKRELPSSNAETPDAVETEIHSLIADQLDRAQIDYDNNVRIYGERLGELTLLRELSTVTGASETALGDFKSSLKLWQDRLTNDQDAIRESYSELAEFKRDHSLRRPAIKPDPLIYSLAAFGLGWVIESGVNTAFLRVGDQYGIVGGFLAAAVIGFINVGFGGVIGRKAWPQILHKDGFRKLIGWSFSAAWLAIAIVWNLLAAHYRDAKAHGTPNPEVASLASLKAAPFDLTGIDSYGIFGMGLMFAVLAATAGFRMDDPYPGFGPMHRNHKDRCDEYADHIEEAVNQMREIRDRAIADLASIKDELRVQFGERNQIADARVALFTRYKQHQEYLESVGQALIQQYRAANRDERTTLAPSYFDRSWTLKRTEPPPPSPITSIDAEVAAAQTSLQSAIVRISEAYEGAIESFPSIGSIKSSLEHG